MYKDKGEAVVAGAANVPKPVLAAICFTVPLALAAIRIQNESEAVEAVAKFRETP